LISPDFKTTLSEQDMDKSKKVDELIIANKENALELVTASKSPDEWIKVLDDEVLAAAILDRLLFKCEVVKLSGKSYRLENRKTIFENEVL